MYRGYDQEEVARRHEWREQDRVIRTSEAGAEKIGTRGGKMHEALTFGEKEPASGRESIRSGGVRAGDP